MNSPNPADPPIGSTDTEVLKVFADGSVFCASDAELRRYLNTLCRVKCDNKPIRHRALLYGMTLGPVADEELSPASQPTKLHFNGCRNRSGGREYHCHALALKG